MEKNKDLTIVYMVAGISSRFSGKIKQFAKIGPNNETLIEYSLNQALKTGFTKIIFVVGNLTKKPFKEKFGNSYKGIPIQYVLQTYDKQERDKPWGTAAAPCTLKNIINCPFVICNGDDIYGREAFKILFDHLKNSDEQATLGYKLVDVLPDSGKIHRAVFETEGGYVKNIKETFDIEKSNLEMSNLKPDVLCSMNIFALHPDVVEMLDENFEKFKKEHAGDRKIEYLLPNEISKLINELKIKMKIYPCNEEWIGITNPEDEEIVRKKISEQQQMN